MRNAETAGSPIRKPVKPSEEMLYFIGDSLRELATFDDAEDGEEEVDDEEDTECGRPE